MWGPGDVAYVNDSPTKTAGTQEAEGDGRPMQRPFKSFKGVDLNKELLFCVSIGFDRVKDYFKTYLEDRDWNDPKRSEKESGGGVSLKRLDTTKDADEKAFNVDMKRVLLLDATEIKDSYSVNELKDEMKFLNSELTKAGKEKVVKDNRVHKTYNKAAYAFCVAKARLQLLDNDKEWAEKRKQDLWEKHDMERLKRDRDYNARVENELRNKFFCLQGLKQYDEFKANQDCCFYFVNSQSTSIQTNENTNARDEGGTIVFDDDDENVVRGRVSLGATNLFDSLF